MYTILHIKNILLFWPILTFIHVKYQIVGRDSSIFIFWIIHNFKLLKPCCNYFHKSSHRQWHKVKCFCDKNNYWNHMKAFLKVCSYILLHSIVLLDLVLRSYLSAQNSHHNFFILNVLSRHQFCPHFSISEFDSVFLNCDVQQLIPLEVTFPVLVFHPEFNLVYALYWFKVVCFTSYREDIIDSVLPIFPNC